MTPASTLTMADTFEPDFEPQEVMRHEEELADAETAWRGIGHVRAIKHVATYKVKDDVARKVEDVVLERQSVVDGDSGKLERLPDGSISIPVFEEEIVVSKQTILRERVIIRKETVTESHGIREELRKERVEIDADPGIELER